MNVYLKNLTPHFLTVIFPTTSLNMLQFNWMTVYEINTYSLENACCISPFILYKNYSKIQFKSNVYIFIVISQWLYCQVLGLRLLACMCQCGQGFSQPTGLHSSPGISQQMDTLTFIIHPSHWLVVKDMTCPQFLYKGMLTLHLYCKMLTIQMT